ncbi:MAG: hypothetical protein MZV63_33585 [Marinilabiliales bacterium]|nr:hypothetical protein [Marinilabiliales bacterium]
MPFESEIVQSYGAKGIGLFRTEFLYLDSKMSISRGGAVPDLQEDRPEHLPPPAGHPHLRPGPRQVGPGQPRPHEDNPSLGLMAVRLFLKDREPFKVQIKAIMRANTSGNIRILFPDDHRDRGGARHPRHHGRGQEGAAARRHLCPEGRQGGHHAGDPGRGAPDPPPGRRRRFLLGGQQRPDPVPAGRRPQQQRRRLPVQPLSTPAFIHILKRDPLRGGPHRQGSDHLRRDGRAARPGPDAAGHGLHQFLHERAGHRRDQARLHPHRLHPPAAHRRPAGPLQLAHRSRVLPQRGAAQALPGSVDRRQPLTSPARSLGGLW